MLKMYELEMIADIFYQYNSHTIYYSLYNAGALRTYDCIIIRNLRIKASWFVLFMIVDGRKMRNPAECSLKVVEFKFLNCFFLPKFWLLFKQK